MPGRLVPNYCERCGLRFELQQAKPGEDDLGLDRIKSAFRYCSTCQRFVGQTCCWNPEVLACADCQPLGTADAAPAPADLKARKKVAVRRLADLGESVDDLQHVAKVLDSRITAGVAMSLRTWEDAWGTTGWLIARADTSRDAVARALWPPPPPEPAGAPAPSAVRFEELHEELRDLMKAYLSARASVEEGLVATGQPLRAGAARPVEVPAAVSVEGPAPVSVEVPAPVAVEVQAAVPALPAAVPAARPLDGLSGRWRRVTLMSGLLGAAGAVLLVAGSLAILGGRMPKLPIIGSGATPEQTGAVLGGGGVPQPSTATLVPATATPVPAAPEPPVPSVLAHLDFNMVRVGALQGASEALADLLGTNEVVPFPSPFDRSVRMLGGGTHRFCVNVPGLEARELTVALDLYAGAQPLGSFELTAVPSDGAATAASLPSDLVSRLLPGTWYHLNARWQPGTPATVEIRDEEGGEVLSELLPLSTPAPGPTIEGLCFSASGLAADGELMLDNLRVEQ